MNKVKAVVVAVIISFLILGCETVNQATNAIAPPTIDKAIIGKWGMNPAVVKASGTNVIAYDFHADGTVVRMIVMSGKTVQDKGMDPQRFQANNGAGQLGDGTPGKPIQKFTYSINGDVLKMDSNDPSFGTNGLHQTLYRVVE